MPVSSSTNPRGEFGSVVRGHDGKLRVFGEYSIWLSEDGIHWVDTLKPWQPHPTDYPVSAFFNNVTQQWQMLARPRGSDRRIASHNLPADLDGYSNHSLPQLVLDTDGGDSPLAEFYGVLAVPYAAHPIRSRPDVAHCAFECPVHPRSDEIVPGPSIPVLEHT